MTHLYSSENVHTHTSAKSWGVALVKPYIDQEMNWRPETWITPRPATISSSSIVYPDLLIRDLVHYVIISAILLLID